LRLFEVRNSGGILPLTPLKERRGKERLEYLKGKKELLMNTNPRVLLWNYTYEEMLILDRFFQAVGAPEAQVIEPGQGNLSVHDILFTDKRSDQAYVCDEKIMLFYQVEAPVIHRVMREAKDWNLPQSIYAVVTKQSIEWAFSELAEHLIKERDFFKKKTDEQKQKRSSCPHSNH